MNPQGDLNDDGKVDCKDFEIMKRDFGRQNVPAGTPSDINKDGNVTILDFSILASNFTGEDTNCGADP